MHAWSQSRTPSSAQVRGGRSLHRRRPHGVGRFLPGASGARARVESGATLDECMHFVCTHSRIRVRLKIIGNLETMHDSDLPTFLIISLPIIFKRTVLNSIDQECRLHGPFIYLGRGGAGWLRGAAYSCTLPAARQNGDTF